MVIGRFRDLGVTLPVSAPREEEQSTPRSCKEEREGKLLELKQIRRVLRRSGTVLTRRKKPHLLLPPAKVAVRRKKRKARHFRFSHRPMGWPGTVVSLDWMNQTQYSDPVFIQTQDWRELKCWRKYSSNFWKAARGQKDLSQLLQPEGRAKFGQRSLMCNPKFSWIYGHFLNAARSA